MIQNLDIPDFLENYWQQKPLLIQSAFPDYQSPLSPEELAGLACEEFIESRIIYEQRKAPKWTLENGPFSESRFNHLPDTHWTLLIQGLNKIFPEIDDLLHEFNFIPSWRVDDLMASYAAPEGSVGPHLDNYDVFLLQAKGRRKWQISESAIADDNFETGLPLKLIKDFNAQSEWVLEAGDMLYLPANVAHYGIGLEDCMTFSIGFRAPSHAELLSGYIDDYITSLGDKIRYKDPAFSAIQSPGEISADTIEQIQGIFLSHLKNKDKISDWFGRYITEYLTDDEEPVCNTLPYEDFFYQMDKANYLRRPATVKANYLTSQNGEVVLFVNGNKLNTIQNTAALVKIFCNQHLIQCKSLQTMLSETNNADFLYQLYIKGYLELSDE